MATTPSSNTPDEDVRQPQNHTPAVVLLTTFGIGQSYIFHVREGRRKSAEECWRDVFSGYDGWSFEQFKKYDKPLGESVKFTLKPESCCKAAAQIEELRMACERNLSAVLDRNRVDAIFFTPGVAVLVVYLRPAGADNLVQFIESFHDNEKLRDIRKALKTVMQLCKDHYLDVMSNAEKRSNAECRMKPEWSLNRFKEVDREGWDPKKKFSYPLFFVDKNSYDTRISTTLSKIAGSRRQRILQSDTARVSYQEAEVYVDWSEALVRDSQNSREGIENNFIIAFASWFALVLMGKNSSFFLFQAFVGMVSDQPQTTADAVHQKSMAYLDVADASLPIRWTAMRKDLFLLETIHRNWSSARLRENLEERMKLLGLHYKSLEDERNERSSRNLALVAGFLTIFTLASAIADIINLADSGGNPSHNLILGYTLKKLGFYMSLTTPLLVGVLLIVLLWIAPKLRRRRHDTDSRMTVGFPMSGNTDGRNGAL